MEPVFVIEATCAPDVYMREGVWVEARVRPFVRVARPDEVAAR
jgi:hypothetical protein